MTKCQKCGNLYTVKNEYAQTVSIHTQQCNSCRVATNNEFARLMAKAVA